MRLSVFQRAAQVPPMSITIRDRHVVEKVERLGYVTGDQLHRLCFGGKPSAHSWCDERLKRLFHHGYLDRFPRLVPGLGSPQAVYSLGIKGRGLLGERPLCTRVTSHQQQTGPLFLEHILAINEFRINLELALAAAGHSLNLWLDDWTLKERAARQRLLNPNQECLLPNIPDGYCQIALRTSHRFCFFLELDRGTQDRKVFHHKVTTYLSYWQSGAYYRQYKTRSFSVLVVVATGSEGENPKRVGQLVRWTEEGSSTNRDRPDDLFWFAPLSQATPAHLLHGPLWRVAGKTGRFPLLPSLFEAHLTP